MFKLVITPELLVAIFAALLAVVADWFPPIANWYGKLNASKKKQVMILALVLIALFVYGGSCLNVFTGIECSKDGLSALIYAVLLAAGINQGVHALLKPTSKKGG